MNTFLKLLVFLLILITGFAGLAVYWTFYKPLPDYSATIRLDGIQSPVDIHWDTFGVPHIYASNPEDLFFAVGYVHAQDRLWQMTLSQIAAEGRFAEFFGEDVAEFDIFQRTIGFWEMGKKIEQAAPDSINRILQWYSDGVNAFTDRNHRNLPIEFTLTGINPIPWSPAYSYALSRMMAWELNMSWYSEVTYGFLASKLTPVQLRELFPVYDDALPTTMNEGQSRQYSEALLPLLDLEFKYRYLLQRSGTSVGSNAWVVDSTKTTTGYPLLAGDPHLGLDMPGKWYEVHLSLNGFNVSGATLAGAPVIVIGQTVHHAWSSTNIMADDTDFFLEALNTDNSDQYVSDSSSTGAAFSDFYNRDEIVRVKGGDDRLARIRHTKNGPVISDIYPNQELLGDKVISMKWTGHEISNELWALYQINWADSFESFQMALHDFQVPGQNFMYADTTGNIAMFSAAKLPVRDYNPILFRHGWDPSFDWQSWIPFDELPKVINPASGWIANANNKLHTDSYPHYLATFWEPPSRIQRITDLILLSDKVDVNYFQQMQNDSYSEHAKTMTEIILPILRGAPDSYDFSMVFPYLENWDYRYEKTSTAASLMDVFFLHLTRNTLEDELGTHAFENFIRLESMPVRVLSRLIREDSRFFNNIHMESIQTRNEIIRQSMEQAVEWLTLNYGPDAFQWRWENLHTIHFRPPLFAQAAEDTAASKALQLITNNLLSKGPFSTVGHGMTINNGQYDWISPYKQVLGPSIRRIADLSQMSRSFSIIPTGQSGNPLSEHFGDQTDMWLEGNYRFFYQDSTLFNEVSLQTMRLIPKTD